MDETAILEVVSTFTFGCDTDRVCHQLNASRQKLGSRFEKLSRSQAILGYGGWWLTPEQEEKLWKRFEKFLTEWHKAAPERMFAKVEALPLPMEGKARVRWLEHLEKLRKVRLSEDGVALGTFRPKLKPKQQGLFSRLLELMTSVGVEALAPRTLAIRLGVPRQAVEDLLDLGIKTGDLVELSDDLIYPTTVLAKVEDAVRGFDGPFGLNDVRDRIGGSRRTLVGILEYFDEIGVTKRKGDLRVIV